MQQRRKDAAAKAEDLAEQQRLRLLEKERIAEANRLLVGSTVAPLHLSVTPVFVHLRILAQRWALFKLCCSS